MLRWVKVFCRIRHRCQRPTTDLEAIFDRIIIGGFPSLIDKNVQQASDLNRAYVDLLVEVDTSRFSHLRRDPIKVIALLRSLALNSAKLADISAIEKDVRANEYGSITRPTVYDYLDALNWLMVMEDQPAWNTHIRSSQALRKAPKRRFTDVSLASLGK